MVWGARSPNSRCQQGHSASAGSRGKPFLPLPASGGSWRPLVLQRSLQSLPLSSHVGLPYILVKTLFTAFRVYSTPLWPHLNKLHVQGPYFQIKLHFQALRITILIYEFGSGETQFNHTTVTIFLWLKWTWRVLSRICHGWCCVLPIVSVCAIIGDTKFVHLVKVLSTTRKLISFVINK